MDDDGRACERSSNASTRARRSSAEGVGANVSLLRSAGSCSPGETNLALGLESEGLECIGLVGTLDDDAVVGGRMVPMRR
jgi:hypothetical protein